MADISIDAVLKDPVIAGREYDGKRCFSRYVYLWDYQRNRVVDFMTVRVVFRAQGSHKIISAYPSRAQLRPLASIAIVSLRDRFLDRLIR